MANKKISELDAAGAITRADTFAIARGGTSYGLSSADMLDAAMAGAVTPEQFGAIGDGQSHPLSATFATLAEAQAVYPHAVSLDDEMDWIGWQGATNYIYDRDDAINGGTTNWSAGTIRASGQYLVNRPVVFNHSAIRIVGKSGSPSIYGKAGATSIKYNGPAGTEDAPVYIFDFYLFDENGDPPPGRNGNSAQGGGIKVQVENMTFVGVDGASYLVEGSSNYVSAILLRQSIFAQVTNCTIGNGLYDGIVVRAPALFLIIERNFFYGQCRDSIAIWRFTGNFSTTVWIRNNEFGFAARYAILMDLSGSVEAMPIVENNSFEHTSTGGFYTENPEYFVHGVRASVCYINCGNLIDSGNRFEGTAATNGHYADYHLVNSGFIVIENSTGTNIVMSNHSQTQARSDDAITYETANGYLDITDARNYRVATVGDTPSGGGVSTLTLKKIYNLGKVFSVAAPMLSTSGYHNFEEVAFDHWVLPVKAATAREGYVVEDFADAVPVSAASPSINRYANVQLRHMFVFNGVGGVAKWGIRGLYRCISATTAGASSWAAETAYSATWDTSTITKPNRMLVRPTTYNGFIYRCTVAGTSGTSEPTWPTTIGNTVVDGTVTWECFERCYADEDDLQYEEGNGARRTRTGTAAPTTGQWYAGDRILNISPSAGGNAGWICTSTYGIPGTWKTYGTIAS